MTGTTPKTGIIVPCWDTLRADSAAYETFISAAKSAAGAGGLVVFSEQRTAAPIVALRDRIARSVVLSPAIMSTARLARLCPTVLRFEGGALAPAPIAQPKTAAAPRFGYIISNGFGLGHVMRMQAVAQGLDAYGPHAVMSFSAGRWSDAFYLPSAQYLELSPSYGRRYTRAATDRFFKYANPTHVFYDGNVLSEGLLAALAARPDIHLTWIRRGMWQADTLPQFMAQQALADLVIEPGDLSDEYDTGPSWQNRHDYAEPATALKTAPIRARGLPMLDREAALAELGLDPSRQYALLMLGAHRNDADADILESVIEKLHAEGRYAPVIAHWPISPTPAPHYKGAITIERLPIAHLYRAFDLVVSAAGYNSFHELMAAGIPTIFIPQEDEGRDQQLARARYAADKGWAALCRRADLDEAPMPAAPTPPPSMNARWLTDWSPIVSALGITQTAKSAPSVIAKTKVTSRMLAKWHRAWKRDNTVQEETRFVIALGVSAETCARALEDDDSETTIIVTDTANPTALRRAGFKYVWLNTPMLGARGVKSQVLTWFDIWRPETLIVLRP